MYHQNGLFDYLHGRGTFLRIWQFACQSRNSRLHEYRRSITVLTRARKWP